MYQYQGIGHGSHEDHVRTLDEWNSIYWKIYMEKAGGWVWQKSR